MTVSTTSHKGFDLSAELPLRRRVVRHRFGGPVDSKDHLGKPHARSRWSYSAIPVPFCSASKQRDVQVKTELRQDKVRVIWKSNFFTFRSISKQRRIRKPPKAFKGG